MDKKQLSYILILILGCASQGPPPGGAEDTEGPKFLDGYLVNSSKKPYIEVTFDESIDNMSAMDAFSIIPKTDFTIKTKGRKVVIYPDLYIQPDSSYRVNISRSIKDLKGNFMNNAASFIVCNSCTIPTSNVTGSIYNADNSMVYMVSLHDCYEPELVHFTTETSYDNSFKFSNIDQGKYFLSVTVGADLLVKDRILEFDYGISQECISISNNQSITDISIMISSPLINEEIISAQFINQMVVQIATDRNNRYFKIQNNKNESDSIIVRYKFSNHAQEYIKTFGPIPTSFNEDIIPPKLEFSYGFADSFFMRFSEPVQFGSSILSNGIDIRESLPGSYYIITDSSLSLDGSSITDYAGNNLEDSLIVVAGSIKDKMSYGTLVGRVLGKQNTSYLVEARSNDSSNIIRARTLSYSGDFNLIDMPEGEYTVYIYEDRNPIGREEYFSGSIEPFSFGSRFIHVGNTIEVIGGWEITLEDIKFNKE